MAVDLAPNDIASHPSYGSTLQRPCWICSGAELIVMPVTFPRVATCVCGCCGLIQRRTLDAELETRPRATTFYAGDQAQAFAWLNKRTLFDTTRLSVYLDLVLAHTRGSIERALDVGCAEGLFSHLLMTRLPNVEAHAIEPDAHCVEFGRKRYPKVRLELGRFENYQPQGQFDLITDFGAFYRCTLPAAILARYAALLTPTGTLAVALTCSTQSLGDSLAGVPPDSAAGLWPVTSTDGFTRTIADPDQFGELLGRYFEDVEVEWKRQYPYRKVTPFFFARGPRASALPPPDPDPAQVARSLAFLRDYAILSSMTAVKELLQETGVRRVALYGATEEASLLELLLKNEGVEVPYRIHPLAHLIGAHPPLAPARFLDALEDDPVELIILADYGMQEMYTETIQYLGLDEEHRFCVAFDKRADDPELYATVQGERVLNKAFRFSDLPQPRD